MFAALLGSGLPGTLNGLTLTILAVGLHVQALGMKFWAGRTTLHGMSAGTGLCEKRPQGIQTFKQNEREHNYACPNTEHKKYNDNNSGSLSGSLLSNQRDVLIQCLANDRLEVRQY